MSYVIDKSYELEVSIIDIALVEAATYCCLK